MMKLKNPFNWTETPTEYVEAKPKVDPNAWVKYINDSREQPREEKPRDSFIDSMRGWINWGKQR